MDNTKSNFWDTYRDPIIMLGGSTLSMILAKKLEDSYFKEYSEKMQDSIVKEEAVNTLVTIGVFLAAGSVATVAVRTIFKSF